MSKTCLLLYYSFTGEAARAVKVAADSCRALGWAPTICAIEFADPALAPERPFTIATSRFWTQAARQGRTYPMRYDPMEAISARYDLVFLFGNTWGGAPSVPVRSFLESPAAAVLRDTPFALVIVCRRLWKQNAATARALGEAAGGRFVEAVGLIHWGGKIGSLVQTVTYLLRGDAGRKRLLGISLPRYGLSDASLARIPAFVARILADRQAT